MSRARIINLPVLLLVLASAATCSEVEVVLYAEALCPYCASALREVISPLVDSELGKRFDFRYSAWGNAFNTTSGVRCQHGPAECRLNRIFSCATALSSGGREQWLPFLLCVEAAEATEREAAVVSCAEAAGLKADSIEECATGAQGDELERQAAAETAALQPPHTYVPWLLVNGIPLGEDYGNLRKYICVALQGDMPELCFAPPDAKALAACHKGDAEKAASVAPIRLAAKVQAATA